MNRGPLILTIDEAEYLLDQLPPPSADDDPMVRQLRDKLRLFLASIRKHAEGTAST